jgi:nucleoid-associated protein YgaU
MKITKLHLLLLFIALALGGVYGLSVYRERQQQKEQLLAQQARQAELFRVEQAKRQAEELEKQKGLAVEITAIAGEYWLIAKKAHRDVSKGQDTLHKAKESLALSQYGPALDLARQAINELRAAPILDVYYKVRKGDTLWYIAKMPQHYGLGSKWVVIWRANKKKIPDFDCIYPKQVLLIPEAKDSKNRISPRP